MVQEQKQQDELHTCRYKTLDGSVTKATKGIAYL